MKIVKKYVFFVPLLLMALVANIVNAEDTSAEFQFTLENKSKLDLYVWVADKTGEVIFEHNLLPNESFSNKVRIDDPATAVYAVIAATEDESNLWRIVTVRYDGDRAYEY